MHKAWFQVWGKVLFFWAVTVPILINREDVVTFIAEPAGKARQRSSIANEIW